MNSVSVHLGSRHQVMVAIFMQINTVYEEEAGVAHICRFQDQ